MLKNASSQLFVAASAISEKNSEHSNPLISEDKLNQLYAAMLESRLIVERLRRNSRPRRSVIGFREASEVGCTIDLCPTDTIAALPYQCFGHRGAKSEPGGSSIANQPDETLLRADALTPINLVQSKGSVDQLAIATGVAFAYALQKKAGVVVAFAETKRIKQAHESTAFAVEKSLPIIYVELADRSRKPRNSGQHDHRTIHRIATMPVARNDVVAVYRVAYEAIDKARRGAGPSLIQCISDASTNLHNADPIAYMEGYLKKKNLWSPDLKRSIERAIRA